MECDICGGSNTPRNPYWRDNLTKTCDPCQAKIDAKLGEARPTPVEPEARPDACLSCGNGPERHCLECRACPTGPSTFDCEHQPVAVEPDGLPLDVDVLARVLERMEIDCDPKGNIAHSTCDHDEQAVSFAAEYARLASTPSEAKP